MTSQGSHRITGLSAALCVGPFEVMRDYFVEKLGFQLDNQVPAEGEPQWASLVRNHTEFMLLRREGPPPIADWCAYVWVDDVDAFHAEFVERGADIVCPPTDKIYKCREMEVRLPDGRILVLAS